MKILDIWQNLEKCEIYSPKKNANYDAERGFKDEKDDVVGNYDVNKNQNMPWWV